MLVCWLRYLLAYQLTRTADNLLLATMSAVRETAASLSLGLIRPALFSLRCQIDLVLSWLFYKDHQVEWNHVNDSAEGFKLKKDLLQYLDAHHARFKSRFNLLGPIATRKTEDPYRLLSAHIHAQSAMVLPDVNHLKHMVRPVKECMECAKAQFEVAEYVNDVLLSIYAPNWHSLPAQVQNAVIKRFVSPQQRTSFLE